MSKVDAVRELIIDGRANTATKTQAKRSYRACRTLGLTPAEMHIILIEVIDYRPDFLAAVGIDVGERAEQGETI